MISVPAGCTNPKLLPPTRVTMTATDLGGQPFSSIHWKFSDGKIYTEANNSGVLTYAGDITGGAALGIEGLPAYEIWARFRGVTYTGPGATYVINWAFLAAGWTSLQGTTDREWTVYTNTPGTHRFQIPVEFGYGIGSLDGGEASYLPKIPFATMIHDITLVC